MNKKPRTKILFKVKGETVAEEYTDLFLSEIDNFKWVIAEECQCHYDDVDVEYIPIEQELSDYDVTADGFIVNFKDTYFTPIIGVKCNVDIDTLLDKINEQNDVENCFDFFK